MKAINKIYLLLASVVLFFGACTDPDDLTTETFKEGGLLNITTPALNYVVGDGKAYTVEFQVFQTPTIYTNKIEVYSSFHTVDTLGNTLSSNEILYLTIDVSETVTHFQSFDVMYADLIASEETGPRLVFCPASERKLPFDPTPVERLLTNLYTKKPDIVKKFTNLLNKYKKDGRSAPA